MKATRGAIAALALALAGCGWTPIAPEDRPAGWVNTADGVLLVEARVEMSEGPDTPMSHSTPIRIDAMDFRAWWARAGEVREVPVPYRYERGMGVEAYSVLPINGTFVPLTCHPSFPMRFDGGQMRCAEVDETPAIRLLGGRAMAFDLQATRLVFGPGERCSMDLAAIDPAAAAPLIDPMYEGDSYAIPSPRFGIAPIDDRRAYLAALALPGVPLFLLECSTATSLGPAFDTTSPFEHDRLYVLDIVPDGALSTPAVLRSERMDDPPPPYAMTVRRGSGQVFTYDRVVADDPLSWTFNGLNNGVTGFFGSDPATLLYNARIVRENGLVHAELDLVDVATGEERVAIVAGSGAGSEQGP